MLDKWLYPGELERALQISKYVSCILRHGKKYACDIRTLNLQAEERDMACRLHWAARKDVAMQSAACQRAISDLYHVTCIRQCTVILDFLQSLDDTLFALLSMPLADVLGVIQSYIWWIKGDEAPAQQDLEGLVDDVLFCRAKTGELLSRATELVECIDLRGTSRDISRGRFDLTTLKAGQAQVQSLSRDTQSLWTLCRKVFGELQASYELPIK